MGSLRRQLQRSLLLLKARHRRGLQLRCRARGNQRAGSAGARVLFKLPRGLGLVLGQQLRRCVEASLAKHTRKKQYIA